MLLVQRAGAHDAEALAHEPGWKLNEERVIVNKSSSSVRKANNYAAPALEASLPVLYAVHGLIIIRNSVRSNLCLDSWSTRDCLTCL